MVIYLYIVDILPRLIRFYFITSPYIYCFLSATPELLSDKDSLNYTLNKWVNSERFGFFPKITRSNINDLMDTEKYIVIVVVSENKLNEITQTEQDFKDMVEGIIRFVWLIILHIRIH